MILLFTLLLSAIPTDFNDLSSPAVDVLKSLPSVVSVEVVPAKIEPKRRIIHLLNWHFVPFEQFSTDLNGLREEPLSEDELFDEFQSFRDDVQAVQDEQEKLLRELTRNHKLQKLYCEGLTVEETEDYKKFLATLKKHGERVNEGDTDIDRLLRWQYKNDLLMVGTPGKLMMAGQLDQVLPTETEKSIKDGAPFDAKGNVKLDADKIEKREDVIVEHLLKGESVVFVILGGAHDLSNNIPDDCEYIRVATKKYNEIVQPNVE